MSSNAPYFIEIADLKKFPGPDKTPEQIAAETHSPVYPDLGTGHGPDSQMYALADGAMQAHQERNQFANLVQAAEAANDEGQIEPLQDPAEDVRRSGRKRKRQSSYGGPSIEQQSNGSHPPVPDAAHLSSAASALFRKPSANSKKYTRPPMSALYVALELKPEDFLQLQSAAKNFMLDPQYPDRQDTVGQRGKGDSELVKLRLWQCVKDFLENEGMGEKYFGPHVLGENDAIRTKIWPQDKNALISTVTPLMRRVVTNERQRQYAVKTRKSTGDPETKKPKLDHPQSSNYSLTSQALFREIIGAELESYPIAQRYADSGRHDDPTLAAQIDTFFEHSKPLEPELIGILGSIDHHLRQDHRESFPSVPQCSGDCEDEFVERLVSSNTLSHVKSAEFPPSSAFNPSSDTVRPILYSAYRLVRDMVTRTPSYTESLPLPSPSAAMPPSAASAPANSADPLAISLPLMIHISHISPTGARLGPRREVAADTVPYLHTVVQEGMAYAGPSERNRGGRKTRVRLLCPSDGLREVGTDEEWRAGVEEVRGAEWMDGVVKVLVDVLGDGG